jgi:phytanoyl-CoA hydroxylase
VLDPGDVLFFHCRTFHAAGRNQTSEIKFSAVFTFRPADNSPKPGTRSAAMPELLLPQV